MSIFRADLHCHSTFSDGTLSPEEIIDLAKASGLLGISITDHDTIGAYTIALPYSKRVGIEMISGVEFSAAHQGVSVHILGYAFSLDHPAITEFCLRHKERRLKRIKTLVELLSKHEMPVTEQDIQALQPMGMIGRPHVALAMMQKGYVTSVQQAFREYLSPGKPCYVPGNAFSVEETLSVIHQANGFAVIAHPHLIKETAIVKDLLSMNFDGLEGYYSRFHLREEQRWIDIAKHKGWLITGGSDFHGTVKPHISLGCSWVNEQTFSILHQHFLQT